MKNKLNTVSEWIDAVHSLKPDKKIAYYILAFNCDDSESISQACNIGPKALRQAFSQAGVGYNLFKRKMAREEEKELLKYKATKP